jgi:FkbM family methyltransferase
MINLRSVVRALLPEHVRERIYYARLYSQKFGVTKGLTAYYKLLRTKSGIAKISIPQSRTNIAVRANTSDIKTFHQLFLFDRSDYEIQINIKPKIIVDAGANAGYASVYFANKYPEAIIIAIEPEASNFEVLKENTSCYPNVITLQAAIWNKRTFLEIENAEDEKWAFRVKESESGEKSVKGLTIEDLMELSNTGFIDILKLDIEGAEKEVFSDSQNWLARVGVLIVELHDRFKPGCSQSFYSAISKFSFKTFHKGENVILIKDVREH